MKRAKVEGPAGLIEEVKEAVELELQLLRKSASRNGGWAWPSVVGNRTQERACNRHAVYLLDKAIAAVRAS